MSLSREPDSSAAIDQAPVEVDVGALIDGNRFNRYLLAVLLLCMSVMIVDGYDVMVVGYVAPALARSFGVAGASMTPIFVLGQVGLALGAFSAGPLADIFGRKRVIMGCMAFFACCCLAVPLTHSVWELALLRLVTGIGLGGVLPNTTALMSELTPRRIRITTVVVMFSGFSLGSAIAGLVASGILNRFGWPGPFILGGLVPLLLLPVIAGFLPESVRMLATTEKRNDDIGRVLSRLDPNYVPQGRVRYVSGEPPATSSPLVALFRDGRRTITLFVWATFFLNLMALNLLAAWMPTFLHQFGDMPVDRAAAVAANYQLGGTIGTIVLALIIDRIGAPPVLSAGYVLAAITVCSLGFIDQNAAALSVALFATGCFVVGGQTALNAFTSTLYPTAMRSTGVAWALGVGRFGAMLGPALGGLMLAQNLPAQLIFVLAAAPIGFAVVSILLVGRHRPI